MKYILIFLISFTLYGQDEMNLDNDTYADPVDTYNQDIQEPQEKYEQDPYANQDNLDTYKKEESPYYQDEKDNYKEEEYKDPRDVVYPEDNYKEEEYKDPRDDYPKEDVQDVIDNYENY